MKFSNRYEHQGSRSSGGMSTVFFCNDSILERKVAIKVVPEAENIRRIDDEISALLKMRSKHVVQVYDVLRSESGELAIVQEFIDGVDLLDRSSRPDSLPDYLKLLWQIASGLADIHALNVIHRDIKPNNMKIDREGILKIYDFGLSRDEGDDASTLGFVGTPGFAAPELYANKVKFSSSVDVYAFGATALYLGLDDLPYDLKRRPPRLENSRDYFSAINFVLPDEIKLFLNKCLSQSEEDRPKMSDVRASLAKHLLRDRHRALVGYDGKSGFLDKVNRSVKSSLPGMGEVVIKYDGFLFKADEITGDVYVNNKRLKAGDALPGACVVALGSPDKANRRKYITFDLSHPEIVL